ncbi:hypothetical protein M0638_03085 [Roseomonas sp. NAR14]|uniref:Uncharacterized protein n=1 Tax=Roseomonas acroporae TaxID=2937791 RepID=A0A9X1Y593_9PROT|nr:hypothetical protein [Roseomonas acroporae]MCK8783367.1 hypothetical protein [Roseomonas acroporae]
MATRGLQTWPWSGTLTDDLPPAERLLLDVARLWAAARRAGSAPLPALRLPCVAEGVSEAAAPLDRLLQAAIGRVAWPCLLHPRVTDQETMLLLSCALAQRGPAREALAVLLRWLPPDAAMAAHPLAAEAGRLLLRQGVLLRLPARHGGRRPL